MLEIKSVSKRYQQVYALRDIDLRIGQGEIVCLLGPSGCGKSTLLRIIAGLEQADAGEILLNNARIDHVPTHERGFGLMFQDYALFPHRTVAENIAFGLRMQHAHRAAIQERVATLLDLVGLAGYGSRSVEALSGGERQRVALARSLAPNPRLLMLDEPLGALDRALRERLLDELRVVLKQVGVSSVYVTHDQAEAFTLADQLVLMNAGRIEQQGTPETVYRQPRTRFAARFFGFSNIIPATVAGYTTRGILLDTTLGQLHAAGSAAQQNDHVLAVIRPEAAEYNGESGTNAIQGTVVDRLFRGGSTHLSLSVGADTMLDFRLQAASVPNIGSVITLSLRPDAISVIAPDAL